MTRYTCIHSPRKHGTMCGTEDCLLDRRTDMFNEQRTKLGLCTHSTASCTDCSHGIKDTALPSWEQYIGPEVAARKSGSGAQGNFTYT